MHQLDVKTAYINAPIDFEIYLIFLEQDEGYGIPEKDNGKLVYKLNKSLYDLQPSGRNWKSELNDVFAKNRFKQNLVDPCMYIKHDRKSIFIVLIWVDDIVTASNSTPLLEEVKRSIVLEI